MKRTLSFGLLATLCTACGTYNYPVGQNSGGSTGARSGDKVRFLGRVTEDGKGGASMAWSGTGIVTAFKGKSVTANLEGVEGTDPVELAVVIDGKEQDEPITLKDGGSSKYTIKADSDGQHDLQLIKRTEATGGSLKFTGFVETDSLVATPSPSSKFIEFIGDSITAGYGVLGTDSTCSNSGTNSALESATKSWAMLAAQTLEADVSLVAISGRGVYINYDSSSKANQLTMPTLWKAVDPNDTSSTYDFKRQADVVVINLGTNDFSHFKNQGGSVPPQDDFVKAYTGLVKDVRSKYKDAQIILAIGPMLYDSSQTKMLATAKAYLKAVASGMNDDKITTIAFDANSTDVGCLYHPNVDSQTTLAKGIVDQIKKVKGW